MKTSYVDFIKVFFTRFKFKRKLYCVFSLKLILFAYSKCLYILIYTRFFKMYFFIHVRQPFLDFSYTLDSKVRL